jgi:hypothetical protein
VVPIHVGPSKQEGPSKQAALKQAAGNLRQAKQKHQHQHNILNQTRTLTPASQTSQHEQNERVHTIRYTKNI